MAHKWVLFLAAGFLLFSLTMFASSERVYAAQSQTVTLLPNYDSFADSAFQANSCGAKLEGRGFLC